MLETLQRLYIENVGERTRQKIRHFRFHRLRGLQSLVVRLFFGSNLKSLAMLYGTDKGRLHSYLDPYTEHFGPLRKQRMKLLEIGIGGYDDPAGGGESLRMWRAYFPRSNIFGLDIVDKSFHDEKRIKTFRGSQDDESVLASILEKTGPPDIIIDDGSHICKHVIKSFEFLFPRMKEPGIYVIEDTQTSYWEGKFGGSSTELNRRDTTMGYFKSLADGLNYRERRGQEPTYFDQHIFEISFYHNLIFIKKRPN